MQVSDRGLVALMTHEGIVPGPYFDSVDVLTYGIGHTAAAGAPDPKDLTIGMPADLDAELAKIAALFRRDVARFTAEVLDAVKVPLAQHELDALVSFHYNTGAIARAELTKALNAGLDRGFVANLFMNWKKPAEIIPRREAERDLFFHGTYPTGSVTVWQVNAKRRVIWTPARTLSPAEALALVVDADPAPDAPPAALGFGSDDPRNRDVQVLLRGLDLYRLPLDTKWGSGQQAGVDALRAKAAQLESLIKGE